MLSKLMPREGQFFVLFRDSADLIVEGAKEFRIMLSDVPHLESHQRRIKDLEHKADETTHRTVELLHKTFITPLDREDIHELISKLDDIMDYIDAAAQRMFLYGITTFPPEINALADVIVTAGEHVRKAVMGLESLKNPEEIIKTCVEINRLENEADHILRAGVGKLFKDEQDIRQLIKVKELLELLETVTDRCEDVANVIEGIVLEYA